MESSLTVNVIEQCRISPPSGSVSTTSLPLTFFDLLWLGLPRVQRLFFYEFHHSRDHFIDTFLPNIKHSLSLALQHFFPFAGNLTWPENSTKPEILYKDGDSVLFVVAESDYDFHQLIGNHKRVTNLFFPLVPQLLQEDKAVPLSSFQVTLFPNKGISIGITFNHVVSDGRTLHHFIKSWASISILQPTESLPSYDRTMVKDPNRIDMVYMNNYNRLGLNRETYDVPQTLVMPTDRVLATFVMGSSEIKRLKQWVLSNREEDAPLLHLSTYVLVCSYVWVCLIKARQGEDVEDEIEYFLFSVDCRARLEPSLPITYSGNCIKLFHTETKKSDLTGEDGIAIAAELIGNVIRNIENGDGISRDMEKNFPYDMPLKSGRVLSVAGSTKFGVYETDFGLGKPKKTEVISIADTDAISISECPSEVGAVEVSLARNDIEMDAFTSLFTTTIERFPLCKDDC